MSQTERTAALYKPQRHRSARRANAVTVTRRSLEHNPSAAVDFPVTSQGIEYHFQPRICNFGKSEHEKTAYLLGYLLLDRTAMKALPLVAQGSFYENLPRRLGRNSALDASVACLCQIWIDVTLKRNTNSKAVALYVGGLNALGMCLDNAQAQYESETICASIILQVCEVSTYWKTQK